jgi:hypothetical protein
MDLLHPRHLQQKRYWERYLAASKRRAPGITVEYKVSRAPVDLWSYITSVEGTLPEKLLLQEIMDKGVAVYFTPYIGDFPFTPKVKERARPDFILPDYHIVIEVYGTFWHSLGDKYRRDATRAAMYIAMGLDYRVVLDVDILESPKQALERAVPELVSPNIKRNATWLPYGQRGSLEALRARLKKPPAVVRTRHKGAAQLPGYRPGKNKVRKFTKLGPIFTGFQDYPDYVSELQDYGRKFKEWVDKDLANWARQVTEAVGTAVVDYVWIGDMEHVGEVDYTDENGVFHEGYGYWKPVYFKLTEKDKETLAFYYRWRSWWKRWSLS